MHLMHLSTFFRSYYTWLDLRAHDLSDTLTAEALRRFVHEASLVLACEHDILRPGLLEAVLGSDQERMRARLREDEAHRAVLEQKLARLSRAPSASAFHHQLELVRDALTLAAMHAMGWALFAEAVLSADEVMELTLSVGRCHERCNFFVPAAQDVVRVELLH